jgi:hypothetical protein
VSSNKVGAYLGADSKLAYGAFGGTMFETLFERIWGRRAGPR